MPHCQRGWSCGGAAGVLFRGNCRVSAGALTGSLARFGLREWWPRASKGWGGAGVILRWLVSGGAKVASAAEEAAGETGLSTAGGGLGLAGLGASAAVDFTG